jgi:hypothetical protein
MILEIAVVGLFAATVYEYVTNALFRAKVQDDATALEAKVPGFVSKVKSVVAAVEADLKGKL